MRSIIVLLICLLANSVFAQKIINGHVKDKAGNALPYVNIGIKGGKIGTVSDLDGAFKLEIADSLSHDSLSFSSIGFEERQYAILTLAGKPASIVLDEKTTKIAEVKITNRKRKTDKLGITGRTPLVSIPTRSYQKNDIIEQARLIHLKEPAKILNANIFVLSDSEQEVNIRLNFYAVENEFPGKRIVEKSIIKKAILKKGWFTIDLAADDIYLDNDFVVSFEYLPNEKGNYISFGAKMGAKDSYLRSNSFGKWRKNAAGGCSIYVTAEM